MSRFAEEQIDRLVLLTQQGLNQQDELKQGAANNNQQTGFHVTQPWEYIYTDRREL
jgi:hypothetical protein